MYFGAISTDIKKSSTLWMYFPKWMKEAVKRTNNITEFVFNSTKIDGIRQEQLPNSPEGDAFTFFYKCDDQDKLIAHVEHVAHMLQNIYHLAREKFILKLKDNEIDKNLKEFKNKEEPEKAVMEKEKAIIFVESEEYYKAVYVRIGVAFSDVAPVKYDYGLKKDDFNKFSKKYSSYWESVIKQSERAEAKGAPYKDGIGVTQSGAEVIEKKTTDENSKFTIKRNIGEGTVEIPIEKVALSKACYDKQRYEEPELVRGYMVFVHYHLHIKWEDVERDPHLYDPMIDEFNKVHENTKDTMEREFKENVSLVKVKRSSDSMFYIGTGQNKGKKKGYEVVPSRVWNTLLKLTARLPKGSSIGICYTLKKDKLTRVVDKKPFRGHKRTDYFGDCVNLAARMAGVDWCYDLHAFKVEKNNHMSRVAMCCADSIKSGWSEWFQGWDKIKTKAPGTNTNWIRPLYIEDIPRATLNAGSGVLRTISAHVFVGDTFQVGDEVQWDLNTDGTYKYKGVVEKVEYLFILVKEDGEEDSEWLNATMLRKIKKAPLKQIAPPLPKKEKDVLKEGFDKLKF